MAEDVQIPDNEKKTSGYLPREKGATIVPFDGSMGLIETAKERLGSRMTQDRMGFYLDKRPVSTEKLLAAAGLKFKDRG